MSSTFSNLKFELIGNGEQSGTWGTTTNTNIGTAIEQAVVGMATLDSGDFTANVATLTLTNTNAAQDARALCLNIASGAVSAAGTVNVPAIEKPYIIINGSSFTVTVKVSGQTGVAVPAGKRTVVYNNGTDVGSQINWLAALDITTLNATTVDATNVEVTNVKAKDGTAGMSIADSTGVVSFTANPILSGGTANGVSYLNGSKVLTTGSALTFDGTILSATSAAIGGALGITVGGALTGTTINSTGISLAGSQTLNFGGTAQRITGDFSNATVASRVAFQTSTVNGATRVNAIPNGTSQICDVTLWNNSDTTNAANARMFVSSSAMGLVSQISGTGTYLPIAFDTGGSERVRIDTSGNVGIGTSSPVTTTARLSVKASDEYSAGIAIGSNASAVNWARLDFKNTNAASPAILYQDQSGTFTIRNESASAITFATSGGVERMRIDTSGNLLVGASSTLNQGKLFVKTGSSFTGYNIRSDSDTSAGTTWGHFYGTSGNNGQANIIIYGNGNIQNANNSYGALSDAKLKENVTDATPKLEKLNQVRIVNFNIKGDEQKQIGVIAQELEQIFPGMVEQSPDRDKEGNDLGTTTKSVKYSVFVPMLIKAIQELKAEFDAYKATHP
jgi:hypothetical protein